MAPKRKNNLDMTAEERIELQKKRNRDKQAALRARRAARLRELEEENAKLQQAGSSGGLSPGLAGSNAVAGPSSSSEGSKAYQGAVERLSAKLRQFGVSEAEIAGLVRGAPPPSAQPAYSPPSWDASLVSAAGPSTATSSSAGESNWASSETMLSVGGPSPQPETPFPFSFLFSDTGGLRSDLDISSELGSAVLSQGAAHASRLDAVPQVTAACSSPPTRLTLHSDGLVSISGAASAVATGTTLRSESTDNLASNQSPEHLLAIEQGIQGLFDRLKRRNTTKLLGGREGLFRKHRPVETAAEKDIAATQLLILQLLGATSSQREAYDAHGVLSAHEQTLLETEVFDPRVYWVPNPAFRVRLGVAHQKHGLNLTALIGDLIELVSLKGDVWDWTGWCMPPLWQLQLPLDVQTGSLFFPGPMNGWTPRGTALRPLPEYLAGSSIREVILGLERPGAREAGPFATTCTVELTDVS